MIQPTAAGPGQWRCRVVNSSGEQCALVLNHPGDHKTLAEARQPTGGPPSTLTRTYHGNASAASAQMQADAATLAQYGYVPVSQSYAPGQWGCASFLVALVLCIVLIGFLVFIYMLIVKPDGTLTVVYELRSPAREPTHAAPAQGLAVGTVAERLHQLDALRNGGLITDDEYAARRTRILDGV